MYFLHFIEFNPFFILCCLSLFNLDLFSSMRCRRLRFKLAIFSISHSALDYLVRVQQIELYSQCIDSFFSSYVFNIELFFLHFVFLFSVLNGYRMQLELTVRFSFQIRLNDLAQLANFRCFYLVTNTLNLFFKTKYKKLWFFRHTFYSSC